MAHFAVLTLTLPGHLNPVGAVGAALVQRGHKITVIAKTKDNPLVQGWPFAFHELDRESVPWPSNFLLRTAFTLVGQRGYYDYRNSFAWGAEVVLRLVPPILKELAVDGVIVDQVVSGGGSAAERAGLPFVTISTSPPWNVDLAQPPFYSGWSYATGRRALLRNRLGWLGWRWYLGPSLRMINRYRRAWSLRPFRRMDESYSPLAQISQLFREFDFPRSTMPEWFHYVGALAAGRPCAAEGFPWERLDGRPLIYASLGTIGNPLNRPVYPRIAAACEGLSAQLVLARGKYNDDEGGREESYNLPGNPIVVDYAPQLALLDRAAVLITHAGLNTTLEAISRGVPILALPRNSDQPGNAARVVYSGAGLMASFHRDPPAKLRGAIVRLLEEEKFRRRLQELKQAILAAGGPARAAEIVETALLSRRPVLRRNDGPWDRCADPPAASERIGCPAAAQIAGAAF